MKTADQILKSKLYTLDALKTDVKQWKAEGKKVVFTNGVFDLLHIGHISYLAAAAGLGQKLIIGLNSDASTRRLKGPTRPVNDEYSRSIMLASIFFIDAVVLFEEDTPIIPITTLLPDILVKGGDYSIDQIVGAPEVMANGGEVKAIEFVDGYSSSNIISKIKKG
ncbi:D-glycero-beta-D-manno-heptose 1-phosphate adenylyltransferase [Mucilaginibacter sp. HMF5004]|uniref:D-glycero-beta-D-manno-heptose 1-phosphate adenylyltransferase n=1 Tax=Mucilaginibacter rivuli TaxID=2857527 RepID=UPI001C5F63E7|nr:D-glycero-beta-D-manno-heptose 1-phosphate adenylyltransferase [Mucilaginibacter rivuli]MBW4890843.1 D-glycero-beta-D-manno-heptose 1-phosphate adenylyltransferase [Mucilaginibacter rivuli]